MKLLLGIVLAAGLFCVLGCKDEHGLAWEPEHRIKFLNKQPQLPDLRFEVKYSFTHKGKTFKFVNPSDRHGYASVTHEFTKTIGNVDYHTYYYYVRYEKEKEICLFKTPVSERYCVATDCRRWYDIETNEIVNDMQTIETVYIQAKMLDVKEQSEDFKTAMKYSKEFPSKDSLSGGCCGSTD